MAIIRLLQLVCGRQGLKLTFQTSSKFVPRKKILANVICVAGHFFFTFSPRFMKINSCRFFHDSAVLIFTRSGAQVETFAVVGMVSFETRLGRLLIISCTLTVYSSFHKFPHVSCSSTKWGKLGKIRAEPLSITRSLSVWLMLKFEQFHWLKSDSPGCRALEACMQK